MKTKFKFKIEEVDDKQIVVRFGKVRTSIDDCQSHLVDLDKLVYHDCESFVDSLVNYLAYYVIKDEYDDALRDSIAEKISGELDISSLKNRIIGGEYRYNNRTLIPMRRIEL